MSAHHFLHPRNWKAPRGYAHGVVAQGRMVFLGGQVGWTAAQEFETDDFALQVAQALRNIAELLAEAGGGPEHLVRLTWYVKDKRDYLAALPEIGAHYRAVLGRNFPAMALVQVADLVEDRAKVEIEATAVLPG